MTHDQAYKLVTEMLQNQNLVRHCLAVEAIMRNLAKYLKEKHPELPVSEFDEEEWGLVGLLHDADYEITGKDLSKHVLATIEKIKPLGASERVIEGIKAHHDGMKVKKENFLEKGVYAADELSGLITACTLVLPDKKLSSLTANSVMKKFKVKTFAAGAKREQILTCETNLGIPLEEFVKMALEAMQGISKDLGL